MLSQRVSSQRWKYTSVSMFASMCYQIAVATANCVVVSEKFRGQRFIKTLSFLIRPHSQTHTVLSSPLFLSFKQTFASNIGTCFFFYQAEWVSVLHLEPDVPPLDPRNRSEKIFLFWLFFCVGSQEDIKTFRRDKMLL